MCAYVFVGTWKQVLALCACVCHMCMCVYVFVCFSICSGSVCLCLSYMHVCLCVCMFLYVFGYTIGQCNLVRKLAETLLVWDISLFLKSCLVKYW